MLCCNLQVFCTEIAVEKHFDPPKCGFCMEGPRGCIHVPRFNRGGSKKGERVERSKGKGKENVEGMTEEKGKEGMGNSDGGIAPLLLGG